MNKFKLWIFNKFFENDYYKMRSRANMFEHLAEIKQTKLKDQERHIRLLQDVLRDTNKRLMEYEKQEELKNIEEEI